ncbi:MAG: hypothetical protein JWM53_5387 [bacterium]|nr:hypothetical protein [bacterium]
MAGEPDPQWFREAVGAIAHEIFAWLRALAAVTRAPRRFVADWADGRTRPLNPLAFALNGLALAGPVTAIAVHVIDIGDDDFPLWLLLVKPAIPWLYNLLFLVPVHLLLRLFGARRKLRTTFGAAFYAGGPIVIVRLLFLPLHLLAVTPRYFADVRVALATGVVGIIEFGVFLYFMTAALAGAHKLRGWRAFVSIALPFLVSIVVWGWFGIHAHKASMRWVRAMIT